ncbi:MAG TPA: alpha/beta hydrolase-fold protein [Dokdonella sp.]|nr:alpha/beta hydrolase-fold protein [Dokdonella sp.]
MPWLRMTRISCLALLALLVGACAAGGDVSRPIPTAYYAAPQGGQRLVVMLPGRGDDLASMQRKGMAGIIQDAWPTADVLLTGLTMPFYRQGRATQRLQYEVIKPARQRGASEIWIMGISLGGMGAILYDREYPGEARGLLLLSPYLGDRAIQDEVRDAGGIVRWNPGPIRNLDAGTFQHELWRTIRNWADDPQRKQSVWLAYGTDEPFRKPIELMTPALVPSQVFAMPGQHDWELWIPAARALLKASAPAPPTR